MQVVESREELHRLRHERVISLHVLHEQRPLVGCVPTMGALHAGHLALIERMVAECQVSIVTVFVNPTQFGAGEDLAAYPQTLERDVEQCGAAGVDLVFAPSVAEMYPEGFQTTVSVGQLTEGWCGASRPGHFDGVCTVVAKLLAICKPDRAYFGEKDWQQLQVIRRMVTDLDLPVEIVGCPIVREDDGLALSSRNAYLSPAERRRAPHLQQALRAMAQRFAQGEHSARALVDVAHALLITDEDRGFELEYLAVVDPVTLIEREEAQPGDRVLAAAHLGSTRLIDNIALPE